MRDIRFRAWDKIDERFIKPHNLCFNHGDSFYNDCTFVCVMGCDGNLFPKDRIILMQYTGRKDKNGKEIFEGDIFKIEKNIFKVGWFYEGAGFCLYAYFKRCWQISQYNINRELEIIGNIHENPELLNVK